MSKSPLLSFADICEDSDSLREAQEMLLSLSPPNTMRQGYADRRAGDDAKAGGSMAITAPRSLFGKDHRSVDSVSAVQGPANYSVGASNDTDGDGDGDGECGECLPLKEQSLGGTHLLSAEVSNDGVALGVPMAPCSDSLLSVGGSEKMGGAGYAYAVVNSEDTNPPMPMPAGAGAGAGAGEGRSLVTPMSMSTMSALTSSEEGSCVSRSSRSSSVSPKEAADQDADMDATMHREKAAELAEIERQAGRQAAAKGGAGDAVPTGEGGGPSVQKAETEAHAKTHCSVH
jgi:hypothetical protein